MKKILNFEGEQHELKDEKNSTYGKFESKVNTNQKQIEKMLPEVMAVCWRNATQEPARGMQAKGYYMGLLHMAESYFSHVLINASHNIIEYGAAKEACRILLRELLSK